MRIVIVATLTFAAGVLVGSALLSAPADHPTGLLEEGVESTLAADGPREDAPTSGNEDPTETTTDAPSAGPVLEAAGSPGRITQGQARRAWTLKLLNAAYADYRQQKEDALPTELQGAAGTSALAYLRKSIHNFGGWMRGYVDLQRAIGTLADPPRIVLQARGSGNISAAGWPDQVARRAQVAPGPLDLTTLPDSTRSMEIYRETGVPRLDRALVIERVDIVALLGRGGDTSSTRRRSKSSLRVTVAGTRALDRRGGAGQALRGSLQGLAVFRPPHGHVDISISVHDAAVGLVAVGRYVTFEEASKLRKTPFRWVPEGEDGTLGDEPVTLQILADHGGGNPRIVRLDGTTNSRVDTMAQADLWDTSLNLRGVKRSSAWVENSGVVPSGKLFRITRIDWRARLDPKKSSHSDFVIRFGGKQLVAHKAPDGIEISGTWEGEVDVRPGMERRFEVECSLYGLGEATVTGSLVELPK